MKFFTIALLVTLTIIQEGYTQGGSSQPQSLKLELPKSPNAAAFEKYGTFSPGLNTGTMRHTISLYAIQIGNISIPLNINYANDGIKNNEMPSFVGSGWSFTNGGMITHTVKGKPDDRGGLLNTYQRLAHTNYLTNTMTPVEKCTYYFDLVDGIFDGEFDEFNYNTPTTSGRFYINKNDECIKIQKNDDKITFIKDNNNLISKFTITDTKGNTYFFETAETSESISGSAVFNEWYNSITSSSWYVSKIEEFNGTEILFEYDTDLISYTKNLQSLSAVQSPSTPIPVLNPSLTSIGIVNNNKQIKKITWNGNEILFFKGLERLDLKKLNNNIQSYTLSHFLVKNSRGKQVKKVVFEYGYFGQNDLLALKKIDIYNESNTSAFGYQFTYRNENGIYPSLNLEAQSKDYWGYFNNSGTTTLCSQIGDDNFPVINNNTYANRVSNSTASANGLLEKIKYPTGGESTFEYEPNVVTLDDFGNAEMQDYVYRHAEVNNLLTQIFNQYTEANSYNGQASNSNTFTLSQPTYVKIWAKTTNNDPSAFSTATYSFNELSFPFEQNGTTTTPLPNYSTIETKSCIKILPAGTYTISSNCLQVDNFITSVHIKIFKITDLPNCKIEVGGNRIKKIINTPYLTGAPTQLEYVYFDHTNETTSSNWSRLRIFPVLKTLSSVFIDEDCSPGGGSVASVVTIYEDNISNIPGPHIVYPNVAEKLGSNSGKIESYFNDHFYFGGTSIPYTGSTYLDWRSGSLKKSKIYNNTNILLKETINEDNQNIDYNTLTTGDINVKVIVTTPNAGCANAGYYPNRVGISQNANIIMSNSFTGGVGGTAIISEKYLINKQTTKEYSAGNSISSYTNYIPHSILSKVSFKEEGKNSSGEDISSETYYAKDFSNLGNASIQDLVMKNNVYALIEQLDIKKINGIPFIISGIFYEYTSAKLYKIHTLNIGSPIIYSSFQKAYVNTNGSFIKSILYNLKEEVLQYDSDGNAIEIRQKGGEIIANIWGYAKQYPIAQVVGSNYSTAVSFVDMFLVNNPLTTDLQMRTELNKIRTGLNNTEAQIVTYTYEPLVGITSQTDRNNRTTYYEYDAFNRLSIIRDQDNNVLKKICYNYAGQPENCLSPCPPNSQPIWQNTTEFRCQQGSCGNTGYQEQKQIDINPCTNNNPQWVVTGQNTTACPLQTCVSLTSTNIYGTAGFTASYYNTATFITYTFPVPATTGLQPLGTIPTGNYNLTISRASGNIYGTYYTGCKFQAITGSTPVVFYNVGVSPTGCKSITLDPGN